MKNSETPGSCAAGVTLPSPAYLRQPRKCPRLNITSRPLNSLQRPCKDLTNPGPEVTFLS